MQSDLPYSVMEYCIRFCIQSTGVFLPFGWLLHFYLPNVVVCSWLVAGTNVVVEDSPVAVEGNDVMAVSVCNRQHQ